MKKLLILLLLSGFAQAQTITVDSTEFIKIDTTITKRKGVIIKTTTIDTVYFDSQAIPDTELLNIEDMFSGTRGSGIATDIKGNIHFAHVAKDLQNYITVSDGRKILVSLPENRNNEHNYPAIAFDNSGVLHWAGDMHLSPWKYKQYKDLREIEASPPPFEHITYPAFYRSPKGTLFLAYRSAGIFPESGKQDYPRTAIIARYDTKKWTALGGKVKHQGKISTDNVLFWHPRGRDSERNDNYQSGRAKIIFQEDRMHVIYAYSDPGTGKWPGDCNRVNAVMYIYSDDEGKTFRNTEGELVQVATRENSGIVSAEEMKALSGGICQGWYHASLGVIGGKLRAYFIADWPETVYYKELQGKKWSVPIRDSQAHAQIVTGNEVIQVESGYLVNGEFISSSGHPSRANYDRYLFSKTGAFVYKEWNKETKESNIKIIGREAN